MLPVASKRVGPKRVLVKSQRDMILSSLAILRAGCPRISTQGLPPRQIEEYYVKQKLFQQAVAVLSDTSRTSKEAMALVRKSLVTIQIDEKDTTKFEGVMQLLLLDNDKMAKARVLEWLKKSVQLFSQAQIIKLVYHGNAEARSIAYAQCQKTVKEQSSRAVITCEVLDQACLLALRGDASGKAIIQERVRIARLTPLPDYTGMQAAVALTKLGSKMTWRIEKRRIAKAVQLAFDKNQIGRARQLALAAAYFHQAIAGKPIELPNITNPIFDYARARNKEAQSKAAIMAILEEAKIR